MKQVLVIALPGIGDALLSLPAIRHLHSSWPEAKVDVLVMFDSARQAMETNPLIRHVYFHDFLKSSALDSLRAVGRLRRIRYDASLLVYPSNRAEYNLIQLLIGARLRAGHRYHHCDLRNLNFINSASVREEDALHNVEENIRLASLITGDPTKARPDDRLEITLTPGDQAFAQQWLSDHGMTGTLVGMHAGTAMFKNQIRRRWAPGCFAELGQQLQREWNATVLLFGGSEETSLKEEIGSAMGGACVNVSGTTFRQTAALIKHCGMFISSDSGLMHTAAAVQTPCVTIFGPTHPAWVRPYRSPHRVVSAKLPCSPCFYYSPRPLTCRMGLDFKCVREVTVEMAFQAALDLARETGLKPADTLDQAGR
jgi:lipopolysaccharide heptosyltransferase II